MALWNECCNESEQKVFFPFSYNISVSERQTEFIYMQDSKVVYIVYLFDLSMHKFWIDAFPFLSTKKN